MPAARYEIDYRRHVPRVHVPAVSFYTQEVRYCIY